VRWLFFGKNLALSEKSVIFVSVSQNNQNMKKYIFILICFPILLFAQSKKTLIKVEVTSVIEVADSLTGEIYAGARLIVLLDGKKRGYKVTSTNQVIYKNDFDASLKYLNKEVITNYFSPENFIAGILDIESPIGFQITQIKVGEEKKRTSLFSTQTRYIYRGGGTFSFNPKLMFDFNSMELILQEVENPNIPRDWEVFVKGKFVKVKNLKFIVKTKIIWNRGQNSKTIDTDFITKKGIIDSTKYTRNENLIIIKL
jgi:hypothetical protein